MDTLLFEIVELANGDIALQRADDQGEPLLTIHFSKESLHYLQDARVEVARAMVQAGLETASELANFGAPEEAIDELEEDDFDELATHPTSSQLH
ncbi:MAG: hypothetical protein OIF35_06805 [Cellvibrionaceae bacterium]|nr:hypothetical protein [Cellvibrionaceae bacterium]MCV6626450.1 hypothetical protein [Cellvibrionaceae bacterium]